MKTIPIPVVRVKRDYLAPSTIWFDVVVNGYIVGTFDSYKDAA